jgi:4-hydroxy 2-oxovalerate aldolase
MKITLIDCTLRDGGYYNNWDFSLDLINQYLLAMRKNNIDYVEMGFRSLNNVGFRGACAYTTDSFLLSLKIPDGLNIGVMVNASELLKHPSGPFSAINSLFTNSSESPVSLVRVACHIHEFADTLPICEKLKGMGYVVGINLMQVTDRSYDELEEIGRKAMGYPLDVLYFADSLGSLQPEEVNAIIRALRLHWTGALGIHAHDNMGRAVQNTLCAINEGALWVDCTVSGMGRGPGNAQTEYILIELSKKFKRSTDLVSLLDLVSKYFEPMRSKFKWGMNPYYYLSGLDGIHPTFVQEMLGDTRYGSIDILSTLNNLQSLGAKKFNGLSHAESLVSANTDNQGSWSPEGRIKGREVLILGAGESVSDHLAGLERLIKEKGLLVIALNTHPKISQDLISLHAACHPFRLVADCESYERIAQPIVMPFNQHTEEIDSKLLGSETLNFGLRIEKKVFKFDEKAATIPLLLAAAYALAIATSGKASRILLAGFDGFPESDPRGHEMQEVFDCYLSNEGSLPIISITPTKYNIPSSSLYALE